MKAGVAERLAARGARQPESGPARFPRYAEPARGPNIMKGHATKVYSARAVRPTKGRYWELSIESPGASVATWTGVICLLTLLWFPRLIDEVVPLPAACVFVLALLFVVSAVDRRGRGGGNASVLAVGVLLLGVGASLLADLQVASSVTPYVFLLCFLPMAFLGAAELSAGRLLATTVRANLVVALVVVAPAATLETLTGNPIFADSLLAEDGLSRATVGQYHPIVLGVMLCLTIPSVTLLASRLARAAATGWLLVAVYCTYSQGPLAVCLVAICIAWLPAARGLISRLAGLLSALVFGGLTLVAMSFPTDYVAGHSIAEYSEHYRGVLFAQVPRIIGSAPFGFGLGDFPSGVFTVYSDLLGSIDLVRTFDSEVVLWVLRFGLAGLLAYMIVLHRSLRSLGGERWLAAGMLLTLMLNGITVAVHSWVNVALLMALLVGQMFVSGVAKEHAMPGSAGEP